MYDENESKQSLARDTCSERSLSPKSTVGVDGPGEGTPILAAVLLLSAKATVPAPTSLPPFVGPTSGKAPPHMSGLGPRLPSPSLLPPPPPPPRPLPSLGLLTDTLTGLGAWVARADAGGGEGGGQRRAGETGAAGCAPSHALAVCFARLGRALVVPDREEKHSLSEVFESAADGASEREGRRTNEVGADGVRGFFTCIVALRFMPAATVCCCRWWARPP